MDGKTIAYQVFGKTGVLVHSQIEPDGNEWGEFLDEIREGVVGKKVKGLVVYSTGGAPRDNQREDLMNLTRFHNLPTAVIVVDQVLYIDAGGCVVQGMNWTGDIQEQTWAPSQLKEAIATATKKDNDAILEALSQLQTDLGIAAA